MAHRKSNKRTRSLSTKRRTNKQSKGPITIIELMRFSSRQLRERAYDKRPVVGRPKADAPYSETGKLGPDDLRRWRKPEKPIEIIS
jgi:hypothetical protein